MLFEHDTLRQNFEIICLYCGKFSNFIPISFLTGFYVSQVVARWWNEFMTLPWPEKVAYRLVTFVPGNVRTQFIIAHVRHGAYGDNALAFVARIRVAENGP